MMPRHEVAAWVADESKPWGPERIPTIHEDDDTGPHE